MAKTTLKFSDTRRELRLEILVIFIACVLFEISTLPICARQYHSKAEASQESGLAINKLTSWSDPDSGISLNYPSNWSTEGKKSVYDVIVFALWKGMVTGRIAVFKGRGGNISLDKTNIIPKQVMVLGQSCPTTVISLNKIQIDGGSIAAMQNSYSFQLPPPSSLSTETSQTIFLKNGNKYIFTFCAPSELFKEFEPLKDKIVNSIRLK